MIAEHNRDLEGERKGGGEGGREGRGEEARVASLGSMAREMRFLSAAIIFLRSTRNYKSLPVRGNFARCRLSERARSNLRSCMSFPSI